MRELLQKKYSNYVLKPFLKWYLKRDRVSILNGFKLRVSSGVFHPTYFFSSIYFSEFVSSLNLEGKEVLDLGCGSGILALTAYKKGANVTAVDIFQKAVEDTLFNFEANFKTPINKFNVVKSDLFNSLEGQKFDVIVINPPYFFKAPQNYSNMAWNCGAEGEYFKNLFKGLKNYCFSSTGIYMILAQNCDITRIKMLANHEGLNLEIIEERKIKWEQNYIYKIKFK